MEYTSISASNTSDPAGVSSERMFVYILSVQQEGLKVKGTKDFYKELWSKSQGCFDKKGPKSWISIFLVYLTWEFCLGKQKDSMLTER